MSTPTRFPSLLTLALLAAGCGSSGGGSTATGAAPSSPGSTSSSPPPTLTLSEGAANPARLYSRGGSTDLVVGQVRLEASDAVRLTGLSLSADGSIDESVGVGTLDLYADLDSDGELDAGEPLLGSAKGVASNNGVADFGALSFDIGAAAPVDVIYTIALTNTVTIGDTVSFRLLPDAVTAEPSGTPGGAVTVTGGAMSAPLQIVSTGPSLGLTVASAPASPSGTLSVAANASATSVLALRFTSGTGQIDLQGLSLRASGSGDDAIDLATLRLARDLNGDGQLDANDLLLATRTAPADDGRVDFAFSAQRLLQGQNVDLVVEVDLTGTATPGADFTLTLAQNGINAHNFAGTAGFFTNMPSGGIASATLNVTSGASALRAVTTGPGAALAAAGSEILALTLEARAGSSAVSMTGLTVAARGSIDDAAQLDGLRLYRDDDNDGQLDTARDVLLAGPIAFTVDDGQVTLSPTSAETVSAGATSRLFITAALKAGLADGLSLTLDLDPATDLAASVTPMAGQQFGRLLITGNGSSQLRQPDSAAGKDTLIRGEGLYLNDNFGHRGLAVGDRATGQLGERLSLIEMPLPPLPFGRAPRRAYLALFLSSTGSMTGTGVTIEVHRVVDSNERTPWIEGRGGFDTSLDGVCFTGVFQATNRADLSQPDVASSPTDTVTVTAGSEGRWVLFDVTTAASLWYGGTAENFGLRLRDQDFFNHDDGAAGFHSSETAPRGLQPLLLIVD